MVLFLLENTLGAWWAGKKLAENPDLARDAAGEDELRPPEPARLRLDLSPLRSRREWALARRRRHLRLAEDGAGDHSARSLHGLGPFPCLRSRDPGSAAPRRGGARRRSSQPSWPFLPTTCTASRLPSLHSDRCIRTGACRLERIGGVRHLPPLHLACSGLAIGMGKPEFVRLAERIAETEGFAGGRADILGRERNPIEEAALARRRGGLERLYDLFAQAPVLGSLIDPRRALGDFGSLFAEGFDELSSVLSKVLAEDGDYTIREAAVTAQGLAMAAELLGRRFTLVATNVPYLGSPKQSDSLREFCQQSYPDSSIDLSRKFVERLILCIENGGAGVFVTPQSLLSLKSYSDFRKFLLKILASRVWFG